MSVVAGTKHAGIITFEHNFNVVCVSWLLKCWVLLMHGVTMKFI